MTQIDFQSVPFDGILQEWDKFIQSSPSELAGIRALCLTDLAFLLIRVCNRTDLFHPWAYARIREVEAEPFGFIDLWAREHNKSSIITFGSSIQGILRDPNLTIGIYSFNATAATEFVTWIRDELQNNAILKLAFPDVLYSEPEKQSPLWTTSAFTVKRTQNRKEATVEGSGLIDGMPTGKHYQWLVYDDVVTDKSVTSDDMMNKTSKAFEISLSTGQTLTGKIKIVGTRYDARDTYGYLLDKGWYKARIHPATEDGTPDGEPVYLPKYWWTDEVLGKRSSFVLACQYLLNPEIGELDRMFDITQLQIYECRPEKLNIYILVDPAVTIKSRDSCDTGIAVVGVAGKKRQYLMDGYCHKMTMSDRYEKVKELYFKWKTEPGVELVKVVYETYGIGEADVEYFREQMKKDNVTFPITEIKSTLGTSNKKIDRIERIQPYLKTKNIFVPYPTDEKNLTKLQREAIASNSKHLVAMPIKKLDRNRVIYDLTAVFKRQLQTFSASNSHNVCDLIDAYSRLYDAKITDPTARKGTFHLPASKLS